LLRRDITDFIGTFFKAPRMILAGAGGSENLIFISMLYFVSLLMTRTIYHYYILVSTLLISVHNTVTDMIY